MSPLEPVIHLVVVGVVASVVCDVVHGLLHLAAHSKQPLFRAIASLHQTHHDFLDRSLAFHDQRLWKNLLCHQLPELLMRGFVLFVVAAAFGVAHDVYAAAVVVCLVDCAVAVATRGRDAFHRASSPLLPPRSRLFVDDRYHALHHAFPDHFLSAHLPLLDVLLGRLLPLKGRRVVVIGGSSFCADLFFACVDRGCFVVRASEDDIADDVLADADVVVLGHGADHRGTGSYEEILTRAQRLHTDRLLPLEVWAVGIDDAWRARWPLLVDERTVLRHLYSLRLGAPNILRLLTRGARSV